MRLQFGAIRFSSKLHLLNHFTKSLIYLNLYCCCSAVSKGLNRASLMHLVRVEVKKSLIMQLSRCEHSGDQYAHELGI